MPFMDPYRPSIQLGLLKALTARCGFPVRACHAYLDFAALIGVDYYERLCDHRGTLIGDWMFSLAAFGDAAPDRDAHILDDLAYHIWGRHMKTREKSFSRYVTVMSRFISIRWPTAFPGQMWRSWDSLRRSSRTPLRSRWPGA